MILAELYVRFEPSPILVRTAKVRDSIEEVYCNVVVKLNGGFPLIFLLFRASNFQVKKLHY